MRLREISALSVLLVVALLAVAFGPQGAVAIGESAPSAVATSAIVAHEWPAFRGDGSGVSAETDLPTVWSSTENVVWKSAIVGRGSSSPIVWGNRIFLTTAVEGSEVPDAEAPEHMIGGRPFLHPESLGANREHTFQVIALDATDGTVIWNRTAHVGTPYDNRHSGGSFASPTAVTDGEHVYAYFGAQGVYAYDFDGELLWQADIGKISAFGVGVGTSPVLFENLLIIQADRGEGEDSAIVALSKATGEEVWRRRRPIEASWSTPVLTEWNGRLELITNGNELAISYDPASGEELWRAKGVESNAIHLPLVGGGLVIMTSGYPKKVIKAIHLGADGELDEADHLAWSYAKGTAYVPSNLLYDGLLYLLSDNGVLTCLDAATGEVIYEGGRMPTPQRYMASPVAFDGKILIVSADGDVFVVKAGREFEVLRTNSIAEPISTTPALSGGRIYIRGEQHLYAIGS